MKIAIVGCPPWATLAPPLHLGYLIAYLRANKHSVAPFDFNIELYDEGIDDHKYLWSRDLDGTWIKNKSSFIFKKIESWKRRILDSGADIIGVSVHYDARHVCLELINRIKEEDKNKLIVVGGPHCHPGYRSDKFLNQKNIDIFVTGEGETALLDIVKQYEKKSEVTFCKGTIIRKGDRLIDCGPRPVINDLNSIPFPDFEGLPLKKYVRKTEIPILFGRGCIGNCVFCQDPINAGFYRSRSAQNIFDEMELRFDQGYTNFWVNDLIANGNVKQLDKLSKLIIKSRLCKNINISGQMRCRKEMAYDIYKNLYSAGWRTILYGVESGSQKVLDLMKKGYKVKTVEQNLKYTYKAGIRAETCLIVGFPGETEETFQETLDFLKRNHEYIHTMSALYALDLRMGSYVARNYEEFSIDKGDDERYWQTKDGKNTYAWRLELIYRMIKLANSLKIRLGFDDTHFYFYHALNYYHNYKKDYNKSYEIMMDALQYLSTKVKQKTAELNEFKECQSMNKCS